MDAIVREFDSVQETDAYSKETQQIILMEDYLLKKGYFCKERYSHGTYNCFYYKDDEPVVFMSYYNELSGLVSFTTMDKTTFDKIFFNNKRKKVAFTERNDGNLKAIVSMDKGYMPLSHLGFNKIPEGYVVDHALHETRFNDDIAVRLAKIEQNNRNRKNRKKSEDSENDEFAYDAKSDFRDTWWLVLCATMLHEITLDEAKEYNAKMKGI